MLAPHISVVNLGCRVNRVESDPITADLMRLGFAMVEPQDAELIVINTCAVTGEAEAKTRKAVRHALAYPGEPYVVVTGCVVNLHPEELLELSDRVIAEPSKIDVAERVKSARSKKVLVLTKADEADPAQVMEQLKAAHELMEYDDEIVTSSVKNFNVDAFIETVAHFLPEGPRWFPEDMGTDASDETLVAEFVREKVLRRTRDEIPHSVGVICDALEQTKKVLRVHATIYVEREGQKGIIIGKGGEMIKHIGIDARRDLERIFGTQVFLELDVKVKAGWRDDEAQIRRFGYNAED